MARDSDRDDKQKGTMKKEIADYGFGILRLCF
jgi:hypothetical protein